MQKKKKVPSFPESLSSLHDDYDAAQDDSINES